MEKLAPLARTKNDFKGDPPDDMPDDIPHIDLFTDKELAEYFRTRLFVQARIGLDGENFPGTTSENLEGIRQRTLDNLELDVEYAQSRGRVVPTEVLDYFRENPEEN